MFLCPRCKREIRYITGAPSTGRAGDPIAVEVKAEYLITESGRRVVGFREHICPEFIKIEGTIINDSPKEREWNPESSH
jgi:hypothetical protein